MKKTSEKIHAVKIFLLFLLSCIFFFIISAVASKAKITDLSGEYELRYKKFVIGNFHLLKTADNTYKIYGGAYWYGSHWKEGNVNTGEVCGAVRQKGNAFILTEDECQIVIIPTPNPLELDVKDNNKCGGLNVSFTGKYLKKGPPDPKAKEDFGCD